MQPLEPFTMLATETLRIHDAIIHSAIAKRLMSAYNVHNAKNPFFPGCQPSSIMRHQLNTLKSPDLDYYVADKTRGKRYVLFCLTVDSIHMTVLINRALEMWILQDLIIEQHYYQGTLIDCEVIQLYNGTCKIVCFDCIQSNGYSLVQYRYSDRLKVARCFIDMVANLNRNLPYEVGTKHCSAANTR
jgi:hypothetical protein